jgi:plastocyanin
VRRTLRIGAGLGLALLIITCTDRSVTGPLRAGRAAFNLSGWLSAAPGTPLIPIDSIEITFSRADGSVALAQRLAFPNVLSSDSVVIRTDVPLRLNPETFTAALRLFGRGIDWFRYRGVLQLAAGSTAQAPLTGLYVGPGANAARVVMRPVDTTAIGGTAFALRALAFGPLGDSLAGVPIGYRLSNPTGGAVTYPSATTATLTAALSLRDSLWVVAETPTHLRDSTRVHLIPQPALLGKVAGDGQSGVVKTALNALVVRVLDALGGGFKGDTVRWLVTPSSGALLSAPATVTDSTGYASMVVTPTGVGPLTMQAVAQPISGAIAQSPATFTAQILALPPPPPPPPVAIRMVAPTTTFLPAVVTAVRGQSVVWTNGDVIGHTATSDTPGIWDSRTVPPGQTFTFTFTTAGTYTYHCTIHPTLMIGTVVVQ